MVYRTPATEGNCMFPARRKPTSNRRGPLFSRGRSAWEPDCNYVTLLIMCFTAKLVMQFHTGGFCFFYEWRSSIKVMCVFCTVVELRGRCVVLGLGRRIFLIMSLYLCDKVAGYPEFWRWRVTSLVGARIC